MDWGNASGNAWVCVFCDMQFAGLNATKVQFRISGLPDGDIRKCKGSIPGWFRDAVKSAQLPKQAEARARDAAKRDHSEAYATDLNDFANDVQGSRKPTTASCEATPLLYF